MNHNDMSPNRDEIFTVRLGRGCARQQEFGWMGRPVQDRHSASRASMCFPGISRSSQITWKWLNILFWHRACWGTKDKDGLPRKVVGTSCVAVVDFGEEGQVQLSCWMVERVPYQTAGIVPMHKFACFEQTIGKFGSARLCCVLVQQVIFPSGNVTYITYFQTAYRGAASIFGGNYRFYSMHWQMSEITVTAY